MKPVVQIVSPLTSCVAPLSLVRLPTSERKQGGELSLGQEVADVGCMSPDNLRTQCLGIVMAMQ